MAETFGEANVVLKVRLDELQRELDQAEAMVNASTAKVQAQQIQTYRSIAASQQQASDTSIIDVAESAYVKWRLLNYAIEGTRLALSAIPAAMTATAVAMSAVATGGAALLVLALGMAVDTGRRAGRAALEIVAAFRNLDGSTQKVRELHDALHRIPLLGGAIAKVAGLISGDALIRTEAWTSLVAKIEDGQVKVGLLGRAINGLIQVSGPGIVAKLLGFDADLVGQIDKANEKLREMQVRLAIMRQVQASTSATGGAASDLGTQAAREAEIASVQGIERVRVAERHRMEDLKRQAADIQRQSDADYSAQVQQIRQSREEGKISHTEEAQQLRTLRAMFAAHHNALASERAKAIADQAAASAAAIKAAADQQAAEEALTRARREDRADQLRTGTTAAGLGGSTGDPMTDIANQTAAELLRIEQQRRDAIRQARLDGHTELIAMENSYYDALRDLAQRRGQEAAADEKRRQEEQAAATAQTNRGLQSAILQQQLRAEGKDIEAQQEAIRQRFEEQIGMMERAGNETGAKLARTLRDLEIAGLKSTATGRNAEFEQIARSRTSGVPAGDGKQVERDQLAVLKGIQENTKPRPMPAALA